MPLPSSGPISLNDVNVELGLAGTTSISMNSNIVRVLFAVPTNATSISMSNGYGKANVLTLSVPTQNNLNLRNFAVANGGSAYTKFVFNIAGNIGSTSTATAAIVTDTWPAGSEIFVNIQSGVYVAGKGGNSGVAGGNAISLGYSITISNSGVIAGGGGGGGGATGFGNTAHGGAGAGLIAGTRGDGATATLTTATAGTSFTYVQFVLGSNRTFTVNGGTGGTLAAAGTAYNQTGGNPTSYPTSYAAGAAGKAIALNTYTATRPVVGTVLGSVS